MNPVNPNIKFPALRLTGWLTLGAIVVLIVQIGLLPILITSSDPGNTFKTVLFICIVTWYAYIMGVLPMMVLAQLGALGAMWGYFVGTLSRVVICLGTAAALIMMAKMPCLVVTISLIIAYLALLAVEVFVLYRHLSLKAQFSPSPTPRLTTEALS